MAYKRTDAAIKRSRRLTRTIAWGLFFVLAGCAYLTVTAVRMHVLTAVSKNPEARRVLVTIPPSSNVRQIGKILADKRLVRSPQGFVIAARLQGLSDKMKAGRYEISPAMPPRQIAALIAQGRVATDFVTIPEGYTLRRIARRFAENKMADEETFLKLAQTQGRTFRSGDFVPPNDTLEGYLYPDTYRIPKGTSEREIIELMLAQFRKQIETLDEGSALLRNRKKLADTITLASLIEREAEVPGDRPLIASALTNRLKIDMPLQCDATVQYALPEHRSRLFYRDLRVDSPYNTYLHRGLPPTPIAAPGLPSIEAALRPAATRHLFYVARPDGSHIFSTTLEEHNRAVAQMRALRDRS